MHAPTLIGALLVACPSLTLLATSREPIGIPGELTWRVPSLSLDDEAIELFADRARRVRPDFRVTDDNMVAVAEICRRLDGMPLAIELAAARVARLSLAEIVDSLHDRFRLLTGGARTAVRRQQTLRASVDWSHALLTEPERILFRRLAAFIGGFDLDAAQAVGGAGDVERYQVLDQLTPARRQITGGRRKHRRDQPDTGCWKRSASTRWKSSASPARPTPCEPSPRPLHGDGGCAGQPAGADHERRLEQAAIEIDNLRAAFAWSRENRDVGQALTLAYVTAAVLAGARAPPGRGGWLQAIALEDAQDHTDAPPAVAGAGARGQGDAGLVGIGRRLAELADEALDDRTWHRRSGVADPGADRVGCVRGHNVVTARPYFAEALELARAVRRCLADQPDPRLAGLRRNDRAIRLPQSP